jgi:hypothetical protein
MNASYRFLTMGTIPIGAFVGGVLGEFVGIQATLVIGGLGALLPVVVLLRSPVRALQALDASSVAD